MALCDAYTGRLDRARARTGGKATVFKDYRELLASPSVDAVFIATPDHWHKTMAVDALAAGKDIYLEKPMTFTIADGPVIVCGHLRPDGDSLGSVMAMAAALRALGRPVRTLCSDPALFRYFKIKRWRCSSMNCVGVCNG